MRIAIPLLGDDVAPRFCSAARVLIVDVVEGREVRREVLALPPGDIPARVITLASMGVTTLLCGGFNRVFRPLAERLGLRLAWRLVGPADAIVAAFLAGAPLPGGAPCLSLELDPKDLS